MHRLLICAAAGALLMGCSEEKAPEAPAKAQALQPGEYEITTKVDAISGTDNSGTLATKAKAGDTGKPVRTCIPADGKIDAKIFAEGNDSCTASSSYMRGGRMSLQYQCNRPGAGQVTQLVDGKFEADSFEAEVITSTYLSGSGDYQMTRTFTGKRVGDCPAAGANG